MARLVTIMKYADSRLLEIFIGVFCFMWGIYLFFPFDYFASASVEAGVASNGLNISRVSYIPPYLPKWTFGALLMFSGMSTALFAAGYSFKERKYALLGNQAIWTFLGVYALLKNHSHAAILTYLFISGVLMYLFMRSPISKRV